MTSLIAPAALPGRRALTAAHPLQAWRAPYRQSKAWPPRPHHPIHRTAAEKPI